MVRIFLVMKTRYLLLGYTETRNNWKRTKTSKEELKQANAQPATMTHDQLYLTTPTIGKFWATPLSAKRL